MLDRWTLFLFFFVWRTERPNRTTERAQAMSCSVEIDITVDGGGNFGADQHGVVVGCGHVCKRLSFVLY